MGGNPEPMAPAAPGFGRRGSMPQQMSAEDIRALATTDDGRRLSDDLPWDERARPSGPPPDSSRSYSAEQQALAGHLVEVHNHLRGELQTVRDVVDEVLAGRLGAGQARQDLVRMTLRQNNWAIGAYCASYCRLVTVHHTIEDRSVFPHLRGSDPRMAPVIDRLQAEHRVIHDVIEGVDRALVEFMKAPGDGEQVRRAVDLLTDTLLSHLAYEERELVEPLANYGFF